MSQAASAGSSSALVQPDWWRSHEMQRFPSASALIGAAKPDRPVIGLRPHAAGRAARWFLQHFPGDVAYAYKANSSRVPAGRALRRGHPPFRRGLDPRDRGRGDDPRRRSCTSCTRSSRAPPSGARSPSSACAASPSTARTSSRRSPRRPAAAATSRCGCAWPCRPSNSKIPLERKFGVTGAKAARLLVKARQAAKELGITFHVGSQTATPEAYIDRAGRGRQADRQGRRGARPARRRRRLPVDLRRTTARRRRSRPSCAPSPRASSGCRSASAAG